MTHHEEIKQPLEKTGTREPADEAAEGGPEPYSIRSRRQTKV